MKSAVAVDTARLSIMLTELRLPTIKSLWPPFVKRRWKGTPARRAKGTPLPDGGCARGS